MKRSASAVWVGGIKDGKGTLSTESGAISGAQYSFGTRFESGVGTNPEELIGAAHAGCFSMALSGLLEKAGINVEKIETTAAVTLEKKEEGFTITGVHLEVRAKAPGAEPETFNSVAQKAKEHCPVSRVLNAPITMDAKLIS